MWITTSTDTVKKPTAIALGNFDGIHQGHRVVLQPILDQYNFTDQDSSGDRDAYPTLVSFYPHPKEFFTGNKIKLLTPIEEKAQYLGSLGFQQLVLLPFDQKLAGLAPQQFVEEILVNQLQARQISIGEDFRFGCQRKGTAIDLQNIAAKFDIKVNINNLRKFHDHKQQPVRISSSLIRQALTHGAIEQANFMLGRPYNLIGKVVKGQQLGRTIGFPTANLQLPVDKFLPCYGVYVVNVSWENFALRGVMNIGCRPTVDGNNATVEVHLLNWAGDLYDKTLTVSLQRFLRPEQKFSSLEALKQQISSDCQDASERGRK
ncbi:riboflavin kinase/FMN adenylyltransferase [Xenococcus sp. PCC 7305]|uniref:bifunctional riboflavin kinase/FAD synthetase n=1 Tax=Xenococcus sp. PCC 7305 TaxID=102125 RepID=UPI0002ABEC18|nr:bifunctional riboflavin kinase/FAD synthetase [Xenococcus sp. PCC 7305]ELS01768.1 riboflavin kinase/FMN adenylyltransferase [Xenococcus sp. PCC 7305]